MTKRIAVFDDVLGVHEASSRNIDNIWGFLDYNSDISTSGIVAVTVSGLTGGAPLDVYLNGQLLREGAIRDYQRNLGQGRIDFNFTLPIDSWVRIRVFN